MSRPFPLASLCWTVLALAPASSPVWSMPREYAYVAYGDAPPWSWRSGSVAVLDTVAHDFVANIVPGLNDSFPISDPNGGQVYVRGGPQSRGDANMAVIDTSTESVVRRMIFDAYFLQLQPPGYRYAWGYARLDVDSWVIRVIDMANGGVRATIPVGDHEPFDLTFARNGESAFVSEQTWPDRQGFIRHIDTSSFETETLRIGHRVGAVAYNPGRDEIYVTNESPPEITILRGFWPWTLIGTIDFSDTGAWPVGVAFDPTGRFAEVTGASFIGVTENFNIIWKVDADAMQVVGPAIDRHGAFLGFRCCRFNDDGTRAYSIVGGLDFAIDGPLIEINTNTHEINRRLSGWTLGGEPFDYVLISDPQTRAITHAIVGGGAGSFDSPYGFVWIVNLTGAEMQIEKELALDDVVTGIAMSTHEPTPEEQAIADLGSAADSVYVADRNGISIIDGRTLSRVDNIPIAEGASEVAFALTPNHVLDAYVVRNNQTMILAIDVQHPHMPPQQIDISNAIRLGVTADGSCVFVTNGSGNSISVIDTATNSVVDTIDVGNPSYGIAVADYSCRTRPGRNARAYASTGGGGLVGVKYINLATPGQAMIPVGTEPPQQVAITPDGRYTYVATANSDGVYMIDSDPSSLTFNSVVGRLEGTGLWSRGIATSPSSLFVYVTDRGRGTVSKFATGSLTANVEINVGAANGPWGIALSHDGSIAFVTNFNTATVSAIRTSSMTQIGSPIPVGDSPLGITAF